MKDKNVSDIKRYVIFSVILTILVFLYVILLFINHRIVKEYNGVILPGYYIGDYDLSNLSYDNAYDFIVDNEDKILDNDIILSVNSIEYKYNLKDIGVNINVSKTFNNINKIQKNLSFSKRILYINNKNDRRNLKVYYCLDEEVFNNFLIKLQTETTITPVDGYFDTSDGVKYLGGIDGFSLNIENSKALVSNYFEGEYDDDNLYVELVGDIVKSNFNPKYKDIDTMTSSFVTTYDTWIYLRAQNLRTAVNYINGAIIEPGEIFSYHHYAGPYNKEGYVFYYKFYGNGVCQVATTVYNAALLGGLEIVKRSPHDKKSEYVAGGLDATVADYVTWNIDMQWKNTYDYPIYLKAYDYNGEIHVEFWSNHNAKGGKTYETESVWLGGRSYESYLHTYLDGELIDTHLIAYTYYVND